MKFTALTKRIAWIVGILAAVLLIILLCVVLRFGRKKQTEHQTSGTEKLQTMALEPMDEESPVLDRTLMGTYDYTVLEIWTVGNSDCVGYVAEMNLFAEECLHRDDEMYTYVAGVCVDPSDGSNASGEDAAEVAKEIVLNENVIYPQYLADEEMKKALKELGVNEYPTVLFLGRDGKILDIMTGRSGEELCMHLDSLVEEYIIEKKEGKKQRKRNTKSSSESEE